MLTKIVFDPTLRYLAGKSSGGGDTYIPYEHIASVDSYTASKKRHFVDVRATSGAHPIREEFATRKEADAMAVSIILAIRQV